MARLDTPPLIADPQDISGKAALVTGGTTGIGRATARLLLGQGARVLIFGRHEQDLEVALKELRGAGGEVHGLAADVSRMEDVRRVFAEVDRHFGGFDILVDMPEAEMEGAVSEGAMLTPEDVAGGVLYALLQPARCDVVSVQLRPHRQFI